MGSPTAPALATDRPSTSPVSPSVIPMKRSHPVELDSRFAKIKRIRLTVKVPPPQYTTPDQRPAKPKFGRSVDAYLDSYISIDEDPTTLSDLECKAAREAELYDKIAALRAQGRLQARIDKSAAPPSAAEPKRPISHWDIVLSHAHIQMKRIQDDVRAKQTTARRVSRAVVAHFERIAQAEDRERQAEEKRLRALAKFTVKEVMKRWREAINHVRQVKLAQEREELARQGKKQLNAILEQSTQVLEAQHLDLARAGRSRSVSTPASWADSRSTSTSDDATDLASLGDEESDDEDAGLTDGVEETPYDYMENPNETDQSNAVATSSESSVDELYKELLDGEPPGPGREAYGRIASADEEGPHGTTGMTQATTFSHRQDCMRMDLADSVAKTESTTIGLSSRQSSIALEPTNELGTGGRVRAESFTAEMNGPGMDTASERGDDGEFQVEASAELSEEDQEMEREMEEEEPKGDSDAELHGLENDADVPIEVLLRQYGYTVPGEEDGVDNGSDTATNDGRIEPELVAANVKEDPQVLDSSAANSVHATDSKIGIGTGQDQLHDDTDHSADDEAMESVAEGGKDDTILDEFASQELADGRVRQPFLLRGTLRPYQQAGLEWLVSLYNNGLNGILADEMGLGKTIQTIALLAHLACDRGIWGPHLIIVPTSVLLNWEMEFKRFLPGFKVLTYYGSIKERKEKRHGWNTEFHFNVCITSYQLVLADQHIFRRKQWRYMILDEAHNIKNFRSQRWQTLLGFHSQRRLLLTGTPLQNNLMELWSLLYFLMPSGLSEEFSGGTFAGQRQFAEWFSNPMDKAIGNADGSVLDEETLETVNKLHTLLRPYILRRMKSEVEKQLPAKYEHIVECRLSKRQRLLYDEFMQRASTRETLATGSFLSVVNLLMQLRKICNHPDLFEVRPILTSFAMDRSRSAVADFEIKELLVRRKLLAEYESQSVDLDVMGLVFTNKESLSSHVCQDTRILSAISNLPFVDDLPEEPPPYDAVSITGLNAYLEWQEHEATRRRWLHIRYLNTLRCSQHPVYGFELLRQLRKMHYQVVPLEEAELNRRFSLRKLDRVHAAVRSYPQRATEMAPYIDRFAFATPPAVALDLPRLALAGLHIEEHPELLEPSFDTLHNVSVKLQIAFPEARLLQYDCGKLQELDILLRERKAGNHRVLIFTQMTRVLDILEIFLNLHGYRYLRLDGATKVEQRQLITERFNADPKIFAFIASSRSGGVGINLTGADTVIFYDSDFNPAMDRQCEDRAHRIGQTRDVHIYRFITKHTIEENMLLTANHKRALDDVVIRQGDFDWRKILVDDLQMEQALAEVEDQADAEAARLALNEEKEDVADFEDRVINGRSNVPAEEVAERDVDEEAEDVGGTTIDYMVEFVEYDWDYFSTI